MNKDFVNQQIEIYGEPDIGKTKFALSLLDKDDIVVYIDSDRKLRHDQVPDLSEFYIMYPRNVLDILEMVTKISKFVDVIVIDSLPTINNEGETMESIHEKDVIAYIQDIISICKKNNCTIIVINQIRFNGKKNVIYGIKRLGLYYSMRIEVTKDIINIHYR